MELNRQQSVKTAIITGITGQDAAYLSQYLLSKSYRVIGIQREGAESRYSRLKYLGIFEQIEITCADLTNVDACKALLEQYHPDEVYNLAAQSSVSFSFGHPRETIEFNIISVLNLLEAIRSTRPEVRFYQASSSEMYGSVNDLPITIKSVLHPVSPYGISKAAGHWLVNQYRESYNLFAVSGILFNHESYLREETFFVKKIISGAVRIQKGVQEEIHVGSIDVKRDFGSAKDYVRAIWLMVQADSPKDYLVCNGSSISLREIIYFVFDRLQIDRSRIIIDQSFMRPNEIPDIYGDPLPIRTDLNWQSSENFYHVLDDLIAEELQNYHHNV